MPNVREAKRTSILPANRCKPAEPDGAHYYSQSYPPNTVRFHKTMSGSTATTAATAATYASSVYSSQVSAMEEVCPVTGVFADISQDYYTSPNILGKGHYGVVRECVHRATRQSFAVKTIDKSKIGRIDHLQREVFLLANIDHHGIMRMVDCYEDAQYLHIITEKYTGGELFDKIIKNTNPNGCFSERKAGAVIKSVLEAVAYLHENGIVHRDIKPENILFESKDEDAAVKLVDFGLSRRHTEGEAPMTNSVGTPYYMSPELIKGKYNRSTDLWSVGVLTYILLCGRPPFNGKSDTEIRKAARKGKLHFKGDGWLCRSDNAMDFVHCLLRKDPQKRLTAKEALNHPWIRNMMTF